MIFDSHAHYDDAAFDEDREAVLEDLAAHGVGRVVNIGSDRASSERTAVLAERYGFIYGAVGIHPSEIPDAAPQSGDLDWLRALTRRPKIAAIGEIGLDYHWEEPARDLQQAWFAAQLRLARELDLPVVVHSRDAAQDTYDILKEEGGERLSAVIHCFSYGPEMAERFLRLGYYIGIGGVITFKNARKQAEVVREMPPERLLLETDCPYLAPVPHRGKRNDSRLLPAVVEKIAQIRGIPAAEAERITYENAERFYRLNG